MENYYTVSNTASRLNCSTTTVRRAVRDGLFTNIFLDTSVKGTPAVMIPSEQVEAFVNAGGILKRRSGDIEPNPELKKTVVYPKRKPHIQEPNKTEPIAKVIKNVQNKYYLEIDSSMVENAIKAKVQSQIKNLREALNLMNEELMALEKLFD